MNENMDRKAESRGKSYLDSGLIAVMVKVFGIKAVINSLDALIDTGVQLVCNVAGAIDSPLHLGQPEWFEQHLENGDIVCYLYSGATIQEELGNMFFHQEGLAGFAFSAFPACINWTGKYSKPNTLEELLELISMDEALSGYEVPLSNIVKWLSRYAIPQAKYDPRRGWTPREGVQPNVEKLSSLLDREEIRQAMMDDKKQDPQWNRRSAGLGFLLWLSEMLLVEDDELQQLVIEVFYREYSAAQAVQKGCVDEEGQPVVAMADLLMEYQDEVFAAFCVIYEDTPSVW